MTFGIGRGFAEVQILKKVKINSKTVWNNLVKFSSIEAMPTS